MKVTVRKARKEDVSKILEIVNYEILNSTVLYEYKERTYAYQLNWFEQKALLDLPVIVALKNDEVVGFGTYGSFRPWAAYQFSVEHSIYIDAKARGLGIGKILMTELIEIATKGGYHVMIAGVDATNKKSIQFHQSFGFKDAGTLKEVGFKFDQWLDLTFLQLILK